MRRVLEVNCISNLSPNHTLQLTALRTSVSESLQPHLKNIIIPYHGYYCMLFDTCRCDLFQRCMFSDSQW